MSGYGLRKIMERLTPPRSLYYRTFLPGGTPVRFCTTALLALVAAAPLAAQGPRFEITVSPAVRNSPVTGRVYVFVSRRNDEEPRLQVHHESDCTPFFGVDVSALAPDAVAAIDAATLGYPVPSLKAIPAGDYYVQALLSVYTEFHRADGHTLWLHDDQWEGQQFNKSPGNLVSDVQRVHLDPQTGYTVRLSLVRALPPIELPPDTRWVKHIKIQSTLLSDWWGHPMYLGATVLLPRDYDRDTTRRYPRSEEHTSELQSPCNLVCRLLLEKKKK